MPRTSSIALALIAGFALSGCQHHYTHQDLHGTWTSTGQTLNSRGKNFTEKTLVMNIDEHGSITGNSEWRLISGEGGHTVDVPTTSGREDLLGTFDAEAGIFFLVETEETGFIHGQMIDHDEILVFLVQPGTKPVVGSTRMVRKE